ncbi:hypothetical protein ACMHYB_21960 [Sorangium sp. So ce1128]
MRGARASARCTRVARVCVACVCVACARVACARVACEQLESMYRTTGAGEPPHAPALMCMVTLLQGYVGASDAEAVELVKQQ